MIYALVIVILVAAWVSGYFFGYHVGRKSKERASEHEFGAHLNLPEQLSCAHEKHTPFRHGVAECEKCGELLVDPDVGDAPHP